MSVERIDKEQVNNIARHFLDAEDNARALPYLFQAAERAARAYSTPEAIGLFTRAAEIAETSQDTALARAAFEGLGSASMLTANALRALKNYETMMQYAQLHQDVPMLVSAHNKLAFVAMFGGDFENVEKHLHQAEQLARSAEDRPGLSEMFTIRCQICTASGDFETAVRYLRESTQIGQALNRQEQVTYSLTHTANTLMFLTRYDESFAKAEEAMQMSEQIGDRAHQAELLTLTFPPLYLRNGDIETAKKLAEQGTTMALRIGSTMSTTFGYWVQGIIARMRGEYQDAVDHFEQSLSAAKAGMPMFLVLPLGSLGTTLLEISPQFADKSMA
jgi:tetratricopeptide (TPR) repeat protein